MTEEQIGLLKKLAESGTEVKAIVEVAEQTTRSTKVGKRAVNSVLPIKAGEAATVSFLRVIPDRSEKVVVGAMTQDFEICIRIGGTRVCVSIDFDSLVA